MSVLLSVICLSCQKGNDTFDTSGWYFKVKIDNQWETLPDDLGAYLQTEWSGSNMPFLALSAKNNATGEYLLLNFNVTVVKYNADSTVKNPPSMKYDFRYLGYSVNDEWVMETRQSMGSPNPDLGKINLQEFKVIDTAGKMAGLFTGNLSYVNKAGKNGNHYRGPV